MVEGYRLLTYQDEQGAARAGLLVGDHIYSPASLLGEEQGIDANSVLGLLQHWAIVHPCFQQGLARLSPEQGRPLAETRLLAPILYPGALFCAGANYWDHLEEMSEVVRRTTGTAVAMTKPAEPWFFLKTSSNSIIGPDAPIRLPRVSSQVDWEAEIGVVIGRPARDLPESRAMAAVAGYVIVNDLSARDLMKREGSPFIYDWLGQKCFEDAAPMGPWLTPAAYLPDPDDISIKLWINGVLKQNSSSRRMVHGIAEQIAYLSRRLTLRPGDVIATGTPAGVGMPRGEFLKPGDEIRIELGGCGVLVNSVVSG